MVSLSKRMSQPSVSTHAKRNANQEHALPAVTGKVIIDPAPISVLSRAAVIRILQYIHAETLRMSPDAFFVLTGSNALNCFVRPCVRVQDEVRSFAAVQSSDVDFLFIGSIARLQWHLRQISQLLFVETGIHITTLHARHAHTLTLVLQKQLRNGDLLSHRFMDFTVMSVQEWQQKVLTPFGRPCLSNASRLFVKDSDLHECRQVLQQCVLYVIPQAFARYCMVCTFLDKHDSTAYRKATEYHRLALMAVLERRGLLEPTGETAIAAAGETDAASESTHGTWAAALRAISAAFIDDGAAEATRRPPRAARLAVENAVLDDHWLPAALVTKQEPEEEPKEQQEGRALEHSKEQTRMSLTQCPPLPCVVIPPKHENLHQRVTALEQDLSEVRKESQSVHTRLAGLVEELAEVRKRLKCSQKKRKALKAGIPCLRSILATLAEVTDCVKDGQQLHGRSESLLAPMRAFIKVSETHRQILDNVLQHELVTNDSFPAFTLVYSLAMHAMAADGVVPFQQLLRMNCMKLDVCSDSYSFLTCLLASLLVGLYGRCTPEAAENVVVLPQTQITRQAGINLLTMHPYVSRDPQSPSLITQHILPLHLRSGGHTESKRTRSANWSFERSSDGELWLPPMHTALREEMQAWTLQQAEAGPFIKAVTFKVMSDASDETSLTHVYSQQPDPFLRLQYTALASCNVLLKTYLKTRADFHKTVAVMQRIAQTRGMQLYRWMTRLPEETTSESDDGTAASCCSRRRSGAASSQQQGTAGWEERQPYTYTHIMHMMHTMVRFIVKPIFDKTDSVLDECAQVNAQQIKSVREAEEKLQMLEQHHVVVHDVLKRLPKLKKLQQLTRGLEQLVQTLEEL